MLVEELTQVCHQLLSQNRFTAVIAECEKALAGKLDSLQRCQILLLKGEAHAGEDKRWSGPALSCLKEALLLSPAGSAQRGKVHVALTAAYAGAGAVSQCREHRDEFLGLISAGNLPDLEQYRAPVEANLGLAYHEREKLIQAEDAYRLAAAICMRSEDPKVRAMAPFIQHNVVDVLHEMGEYEEAKLVMEAAYPFLPDDSFGAPMRNQRAIQALGTGDLDAAVLWVESGLGHPSCDVRTRAALTLTKARVAMAHGQQVIANDLALDAMRLVALSHSSRLASRVSRFLNQDVAKGV